MFCRICRAFAVWKKRCEGETRTAGDRENESREAVSRAGVEANTAVKDAGKAERKPVAQKRAMTGKEKKPSIHERLEINKKIIQEKQGKDKLERGADLGVR